jgi:hypothetical protein
MGHNRTGMSIDEFLRSGLRNSHVREAGFSTLYVRYGERYLAGKKYKTLDLASIEATVPGTGAFKQLVWRLRTHYPHLALFVENVMVLQFEEGLERLGFKREPAYGSGSFASCFYMLPTDGERSGT